MNIATRFLHLGLTLVGLAVLPSCAAVPDVLAGPAPTVEQIIAGFAQADKVGQITFRQLWRRGESAGIKNGEEVMVVPPRGEHFVTLTERPAVGGGMIRLRAALSGEVARESYLDEAVYPGSQHPAVLTMDGEKMVAGYRGDKFVNGNLVRKLALFDLEKGVRLFDYETPRAYACECLALSADGRYLVSGCAVEESLVFDLSKPGPLLRVSEKDRGGMMAVGFSPDGKQVALGSRAAISVWDMATGRQVFRFPFAKRRHYSPGTMRFGVLGERWVCAVRWNGENPGRDTKETLELVELATGATLFVLPSPHRGMFYPAFFLEDGKHLLCELSTEYGYSNRKDALCLFDAQGKLVSWGMLPPGTGQPSFAGGYGNGGQLAFTRDAPPLGVRDWPLSCWETDYGLKQGSGQGSSSARSGAATQPEAGLR